MVEEGVEGRCQEGAEEGEERVGGSRGFLLGCHFSSFQLGAFDMKPSRAFEAKLPREVKIFGVCEATAGEVWLGLGFVKSVPHMGAIPESRTRCLRP